MTNQELEKMKLVINNKEDLENAARIMARNNTNKDFKAEIEINLPFESPIDLADIIQELANEIKKWN